MSKNIKVGIIGFGLAGRVFHAPLIQACEGLDLHSIKSSRSDQIKKSYPEVNICSNVQKILENPAIDLVINATPNIFHYEYSKQALLAGTCFKCLS